VKLFEWFGPDWGPQAFDLVVINKAFAALSASRRVH